MISIKAINSLLKKYKKNFIEIKKKKKFFLLNESIKKNDDIVVSCQNNECILFSKKVLDDLKRKGSFEKIIIKGKDLVLEFAEEEFFNYKIEFMEQKINTLFLYIHFDLKDYNHSSNFNFNNVFVNLKNKEIENLVIITNIPFYSNNKKDINIELLLNNNIKNTLYIKGIKKLEYNYFKNTNLENCYFNNIKEIKLKKKTNNTDNNYNNKENTVNKYSHIFHVNNITFESVLNTKAIKNILKNIIYDNLKIKYDYYEKINNFHIFKYNNNTIKNKNSISFTKINNNNSNKTSNLKFINVKQLYFIDNNFVSYYITNSNRVVLKNENTIKVDIFNVKKTNIEYDYLFDFSEARNSIKPQYNLSNIEELNLIYPYEKRFIYQLLNIKNIEKLNLIIHCDYINIKNEFLKMLDNIHKFYKKNGFNIENLNVYFKELKISNSKIKNNIIDLSSKINSTKFKKKTAFENILYNFFIENINYFNIQNVPDFIKENEKFKNKIGNILMI